jgi:hypothetical protein
MLSLILDTYLPLWNNQSYTTIIVSKPELEMSVGLGGGRRALVLHILLTSTPNWQTVDILSTIYIRVVNLLLTISKTGDERYFYWTTLLYEYTEK